MVMNVEILWDFYMYRNILRYVETENDCEHLSTGRDSVVEDYIHKKH